MNQVNSKKLRVDFKLRDKAIGKDCPPASVNVSNSPKKGIRKPLHAPVKKKKLSIGTFNVTGVNGKSASHTLNYIVDMLKKNPDILALQEVSTGSNKAYTGKLNDLIDKNSLNYKWVSNTEFPSIKGRTGKSYQVFYNTKTIASIKNMGHLDFTSPPAITSVSSRGRARKEKKEFDPDNLDDARQPLSLDVHTVDQEVYKVITWHAPIGNGIRNEESYKAALLAHSNICENHFKAPLQQPTFLAMDANATAEYLRPIYKQSFPAMKNQHLDAIAASVGWKKIEVISEKTLGKSKSHGHNGLIVKFEEV